MSLCQDGPAPVAKEKGGMQTVWRAALTFSPSDHSFGVRSFTSDGQAFADEIFNQLEKDGFFPGCAPTEPPPIGAEPPPAPTKAPKPSK